MKSGEQVVSLLNDCFGCEHAKFPDFFGLVKAHFTESRFMKTLLCEPEEYGEKAINKLCRSALSQEKTTKLPW